MSIRGFQILLNLDNVVIKTISMAISTSSIIFTIRSSIVGKVKSFQLRVYNNLPAVVIYKNEVPWIFPAAYLSTLDIFFFPRNVARESICNRMSLWSFFSTLSNLFISYVFIMVSLLYKEKRLLWELNIL